jgi:hypothetical protein
VQSNQILDCFEHAHFAVEEVPVMQAPVCADVTVRHWSDKLPNGVVTIFYGRPASYTVIGAPDDKPVLVQCLQHPLRYMLPDLIGGVGMPLGTETITLHPNGYHTLPRAEGVPVKENPEDKVYSDKYVPEP